MMNPHTLWADWSGWLWPLMVNHLWQATLISAVALIAVATIHRNRAQMRYCLLFIALAKFILPAAWLGFVVTPIESHYYREILPSPTYQLVSRIVVPVSSSEISTIPVNTVPAHNELYCVLSLAWLLGILTLLVRWSSVLVRFSRIIKKGETVLIGRESEILQNLIKRLNIKKPIRLISSANIVEPAAYGIWRPTFLLPAQITKDLNDEELSAVMLHELIHVKHWDNLLNSLQMVICSFFWFHPIVWVIYRKLLIEREVICDDKVIAVSYSPQAYAAGLLKVVQFLLKRKIPGISYVTNADLKWRIAKIMTVNEVKRNSYAYYLYSGTIVGTLILSSVAIPLFSKARINNRTDQQTTSEAGGAGNNIATQNDPVKDQFMQGAKLSLAEVEQIEKQLDGKADELTLRAKILGYYHHKTEANFVAGIIPVEIMKKVYLNGRWFVEHYPEHVLAREYYNFWYRVDARDKAAYQEAKALWLKQLETHGNNVDVIANVADFLTSDDAGSAEALLIKAQAIEPDNIEFAVRSIRFYNQQLSEGNDIAINPEFRIRAYQQFQRTINLLKSPAPLRYQGTSNQITDRERLKFRILIDGTGILLETSDESTTRLYTRELLELAEKYKTDSFYGDALHQGYVVFGRLALKNGELAQAKMYLMKAAEILRSPVLMTNSLRLRLAYELLLKGEREVVIQYIDSLNSSKAYAATAANWISQINKNKIPKEWVWQKQRNPD